MLREKEPTIDTYTHSLIYKGTCMYNIGDSVTVKFRTRDYSYWAENEFAENEMSGTVVKTPSWVEYKAIALKTGNPDFPLSIIPLHNIVGYEEPVFAGVKKAWTVGKYIVESINGKVSCTCVGFQYRRYCKHSEGVQ